jgi:putative restriction endonuclease
MTRTDVWTREQLIMALNVYCKIPFKDVRESHPIIQKYAPLVGRTTTALKMKVGNFGRFDPVLRAKGIVGLSNGSKADEVIWNEFWGNSEKLAYESERLFAEREGKTIGEYADLNMDDLPKGEEKEAIVRQRVNQSFFRTTVLTSYLNRCCITGVTNYVLLEACHISSWKDDKPNRTNPKNGLCMTPTFHRAFDKYLMSITPDYDIVISEQMIEGAKDAQTQCYLAGLQHKKMLMPEKFAPDVELLAQHYESYVKITK